MLLGSGDSNRNREQNHVEFWNWLWGGRWSTGGRG
jgi:hypothetical protein